MDTFNNPDNFLKHLLEINQKFIEDYKKSPLMQLIKSSAVEKKEVRIQLLDCVQVFSNYFQKVVMLRGLFSDNPLFGRVAQEHLEEEFGHNLSLLKDRKNKPPLWDAILDSTSSWFTWKMFTCDHEERTVLVHLVLEASANIFFHGAHKVMSKYGETDYFKIHSEADEKHEHMGIKLLGNVALNKYERLMEIQQRGWGVLNAVCNRIAELAARN